MKTQGKTNIIHLKENLKIQNIGSQGKYPFMQLGKIEAPFCWWAGFWIPLLLAQYPCLLNSLNNWA